MPRDAARKLGSPTPHTGALVALALVVVAVAWRHQLGFWFTDTDALADVAVARVGSVGDLLAQLARPLTGGYGGLNANFYRPLAMLHFALQRALFGWNATGWQAWDLGLHLAALAMFAAAARRLGAGPVEAALFVLIAGLHPLCAEVVPAVARNMELLVALFVGLALWAAASGRPLMASACGLAALGSKEPAAALLPLIALVAAWTHGRKALVRVAAPWLVGVPVFLAARAHVLGGAGGYHPGEVIRPSGLLHVLRDAGLDSLATPHAVALTHLLGRSDLARYGAGTTAILLLTLLLAIGWRHLGPRAVVAAGLWLLPVLTLGLTAAYTRRQLTLPALGIGLLLAGLLCRGGAARLAALPVLLSLAPGTPLWRPYLDWGAGASVARASTEGLAGALGDLPRGTTLWLADRPLRHDLDRRRAKFWRQGETQNNAMARYSLQAWLDEAYGEGALEVRSLTVCEPEVPMGPAAATVVGGAVEIARRDFQPRIGPSGTEAGWLMEEAPDAIALVPPPDAEGDAVLVFGEPAALLRVSGTR